ncbi:MAG: (Fe-S)-binding protein [Candidatus Eisenbacteria bacterium]|nr:(Fe-S)-binding protein [Candidatus Eisenbacteria bacterium]
MQPELLVEVSLKPDAGLERKIAETKAYNCVECGICTGSCPVSRVNPNFSPRLMVEKLLLGPQDEILADKELWSCLTCKTCSVRCPAQVDYNEFMRAARVAARQEGFEGVDTHAGVLRSIMELHAKGFRPKSTRWLDASLRTCTRGDDFYFVGCLPYFDVVFKNIELESTPVARSAVRLMNLVGITPVVSENERCCGHDLYWSGNHDDFVRLAKYNLKLISGSGAKRVIFTCPEGYYTFSKLYPEALGKLKFDVLHVTDILLEKVKKGGLVLHAPRSGAERTSESGAEPLKVTLQDPCRMGRMMGRTEEMRELLALIPGVELIEMPRNRANAVCCGSSAWITCTLCNKQIQLDRLAEAKETGASTLITACPKCRIHLTCAQYDKDRELNIGIRDIVSLVLDAAG